MPTGIPGLDEAVRGGLITQNSYLIVGGPGTGKTIFSFQWLLEGARRGESALCITPAEPGGKIERNVGSFGWRLGGVCHIGKREGPAGRLQAAERGIPQQRHRARPQCHQGEVEGDAMLPLVPYC